MSITLDSAPERRKKLGLPLDNGSRLTGLRIAVAGCGYWGSKHARVLSGTADATQLAIVEPNPALRRSLRTAFPAADAYSDLESALPNVDAVVIATPPSTHARLALTVIRAGKHVLIEKPMATSVVDARELVDEAHRHGVVLMAGHIFQFNPAVRELRRRLLGGDFGKIHYIHSARLNLGLYQPDVNVVWDLAPHDISILNYLLGAKPVAAMTWGETLATGHNEDLAYIRLQYDNPKVSGYVHLSWLDPRKTRTVTVVGSEKMAVYDDLAEERLRIYDRGVEWDCCTQPLHERPPTYRYGDIVVPHIGAGEPLALQDAHFISSILEGSKPETCGSRGAEVVAVLEAIEKSMRSRAPVHIEDPAPAGGDR